jgi:hypothetical protein
MTHIPRYFLALFASLRVGDELILHKGREPREKSWKVELVQLVSGGTSAPIPFEVWREALIPLPEDWQGRIHFYGDPDCPGVWVARRTIFPSLDHISISGMTMIEREARLTTEI